MQKLIVTECNQGHSTQTFVLEYFPEDPNKSKDGVQSAGVHEVCTTFQLPPPDKHVPKETGLLQMRAKIAAQPF